MNTKTIPALPFADFVAGSIKGAVANAGGSKRDRFFVPRDAIHVKPEFNVRDDTAEYRAHVEDIAHKIAANGFYPSKALACVVEKGEDGANVIYVKDGHTRLAAIDYACNKLGAEIDQIPIDVVSPGTSAEDLTISLVTENSGRPLSPYEIAKVCKRLIDFGMEEKEIARRLNFTPAYIKNMLSLIAAPKAIRDMVSTGKVSASLAVATMKKEGKNAVAVLKDAEAVATTKGKAKVTGKAVKATKSAKPAKAPSPLKGKKVAATVEAPARAFPAAISVSRLPDQPTAVLVLLERDFSDDELAALTAYLG